MAKEIPQGACEVAVKQNRFLMQHVILPLHKAIVVSV